MKIFALVLCVAFVSAAPQVEVNDDDFELRKCIFIFMFFSLKIYVFWLYRIYEVIQIKTSHQKLEYQQEKKKSSMSMNTLRQYFSIANSLEFETSSTNSIFIQQTLKNKIYLKRGLKLRKSKQFYWNFIEHLSLYIHLK